LHFFARWRLLIAHGDKCSECRYNTAQTRCLLLINTCWGVNLQRVNPQRVNLRRSNYQDTLGMGSRTKGPHALPAASWQAGMQEGAERSSPTGELCSDRAAQPAGHRPPCVCSEWRLGPRAQRHLLSALDGLALVIGLSCDVLVAVHGHLLQRAAHGGQGAKKRKCAFLSRKFPKKAPTHLRGRFFFFQRPLPMAPRGPGLSGPGTAEARTRNPALDLDRPERRAQLPVASKAAGSRQLKALQPMCKQHATRNTQKVYTTTRPQAEDGRCNCLSRARSQEPGGGAADFK
jgi:hypothetical protein